MPDKKKSGITRFFLVIDKFVDGFCITLLVLMILNVFMAVLTRKLFSFVPSWSEEMTLLFLTWFTFIGIAIGFRESLHLGMDLFDNLPKKVLHWMDKFVDACTFLFGLYLVIYGWDFSMMMRGSFLAATHLPNLLQYIVMPITGVLTCAYSALQFLGFDISRYHSIDEEITRDAK